MESITLYTYSNYIGILKEIIDTAHKEFILKDNTKLNVYSIHEWGFMWQKSCVKDPR